ncbi:uncharacterized protein LOC141911056 [Tubulanus polymorphus]|uniref:uncharacterized protein LOC141911056 n=1 Tax=Tubulanus polymorphus TaxID=672921 RepID=UPI003DA340B2
MDFESIEYEIQKFVSAKSAEKVFLEVKQTCISVKHSSKCGSTVLAILWVKVLQHANNFPASRYPYKKHKDHVGVEKLILKAEDVTITVYMKKGTIMIQGQFILDWFRRRFLELLERYDAPCPLNPVKPMSYPINNGADEIISAYVPGASFNVNIHEQKDSEKEIPPAPPATAETLPVSIDDIVNCMESLNLDMLTAGQLKDELRMLRNCCVKNGQKYIYPLWRALLNKWIGQGYKTFIVTPFLDKDRLMNVADILLTNRNNVNAGELEAMYVRKKCDDPKSIHQLKKELLDEYLPNKQVHIEYHFFSKIIYPIERFHCKFIAGVKDDKAEVLITSANFHANHFVCDNFETVVFQTMSEKDFRRCFIKPIISCVSSDVNNCD